MQRSVLRVKHECSSREGPLVCELSGKEVQMSERKTETIEEYLARGGKITVCPPGARSEDVVVKHRFSRGSKKKSTAAKKKKSQ